MARSIGSRTARLVTAHARSKRDGFEFSVATAPATMRHRQLALAVIAATVIAYIFVAANASVPLAHVNSFVPAVYAITVITDLVTAVLLFAQFSASGSRPLLVLASGYLFSCLIVIGVALTFPGAFAPAGMLGAGPQSSAWLNVLWRLGLAVTIAAYAVLRMRTQAQNAVGHSPQFAVLRAVVIVSAVAGALIVGVTAGHDLLPLVVQDGQIQPLGRYANVFIILASLFALVLLIVSTRGRTILDLWLIVAAFALLAESTMVTFFITARFTLGFYALRLISVPVSKVVLAVLLWETVRLYTNLATTIRELRRERSDKLINAALGLAAIAHEIRQPLTGIGLAAVAGQRLLNKTPPDVDAASALFENVKGASTRANEIFGDVLRLLKGGDEPHAIDLNTLTLEATRLLRSNLDDQGIEVFTQLASDLPFVMGHSSQLREVMLNLIQSSIDAMGADTDAPRRISIVTARTDGGAVSISFQDTGPGIEPDMLPSLFDPFVNINESGAGPGLAICKMIVEHHGGELSASSKHDGGARFSMTLPTA